MAREQASVPSGLELPGGPGWNEGRSYVSVFSSRRVRAQMFQCLPGCQLLRLFLGRPFRPGDVFGLLLSLRIDARLYRKDFAMVRPFFLYRSIDRLQATAGLEKLLQGRLVIGKTELVRGFHPYALQLRLQYSPDDESARLFHAHI